jgi:predicted MFS family arabinose efflux permease
VGIAFGTFVGGVVVSGPGIRAVDLVGAVLAVVAAALVGVTLALTKREESRG